MATGWVFKPRRHEVSRVEGFSDAVFAFAVTLLVVSLEVPKTFNELMAAMRQFLAFAICFAMLFQVWWRHHNFFRRYGLADPFSITMTGILLFVVLFYVYPLKFVFVTIVGRIMGQPDTIVHADGTRESVMTPQQVPQVMMIYSLGFVAVFAVFTFLHLHAYRKRDTLELDAHEAFETRITVLDNLAMVAIGLVSVAFALIAAFTHQLVWAMGSWLVYFSIGFVQWALGEHSGRGHRRLDTPVTKPQAAQTVAQ